ncbi:MAG: hypothetical protein A3D47_01195 [Candidatus Colwellbacteria bacterium RIFCSPHIGHO2_02_FULL_43_15]|uniref:DUF378 domain-containing protein n=2 Tax=Candidatus Colwelliibacteriota TaxID=1817904 RepID=A0A1G1YZ80_9BACT|nr:MAG: hypothetical protein A3D47_01195 [Candidatus Colwellbacteria bacterium RIFCSPHIGHO2_02_FULL_43_15]OGY61004.1 MAG: hypothetical protein A3F99_00425 [Candidatus Colwellbacteria bacterium RIFCSPLOWO2_12_FULL_43_11]
MDGKMTHVVAWTLVMVGGLNWGLVGLGGFMGSDWNVVHMVLGSWMQLEAIVYVVVGLSTVYLIAGHKKNCRMCNP